MLGIPSAADLLTLIMLSGDSAGIVDNDDSVAADIPLYYDHPTPDADG